MKIATKDTETKTEEVKNDSDQDNKQQDDIITRTIETGKNKFDFRFLIVDSAEKWKAADEYSCDYNLTTNEKQTLKIRLTGISLTEWEKIELDCPVPNRPETENEDELYKYEEELNKVLMQKRIRLFEKSSQKDIPGETIEDKVKWISERVPSQIEGLSNFIQDKVCGFSDGSMIDNFNAISSDGKTEKQVVKLLDDFTQWEIAVNSSYFFRVHHEEEDFILEFPLTGISEDQKREILSATKEPVPQKIPKRDPKTKRFDPTNLVPNFEDPAWIESIRAISQKRTVLYFEAVLPFELPGRTIPEKYKWLSQRLVGEVIRLKRYIETSLAGFGDQYDFF